MQVEVSSALEWALKVIGILLSLNLGSLVYIFKALKSDLHDVSAKVEHLETVRFKLIHKDDCQHERDRISERIDRLEESVYAIESQHAEPRHGK